MLPFLAIYYLLLILHEVWRDEINAWAIAYVSPNLGNLLSRVHYEAHPALWYVILFAASRITYAVWMLKLVQALISTGIYLLLALASPFRRYELLLIYGGYYIAFQYTVMCRMYGLEVLFALAYIWFRTNRPHWLKRNVLWLGLIANVDITAGILATGLLLEYVWDQYRQRNRSQQPALRPVGAALAIYAALSAVSLATLWPARDISWNSSEPLFSQVGDPLHLGYATALWAGLPWYPQTISPASWWPDLNFWPQGFFVPFVLVCYFLVFRGHRSMAWMFGFVVLAGITFSHGVSVAAVRHVGIVYVAFLVALWTMRFREEKISPYAYVLLGAGVLASLMTLGQQWGRPFTDSAAAATWIEEQKFEDLPLFGTTDAEVFPVTERLHRPLYQLDCNCQDMVMTFHHRRDSYKLAKLYDTAEVARRTAAGMERLSVNRALLLLNFPLRDEQWREFSRQHVQVVPAARFDRGLLPDEHYYIYRLFAP
jgi:hypothetical protein